MTLRAAHMEGPRGAGSLDFQEAESGGGKSGFWVLCVIVTGLVCPRGPVCVGDTQDGVG